MGDTANEHKRSGSYLSSTAKRSYLRLLVRASNVLNITITRGMPARVLQSSFYTTAVGWDTRTTWQPSTLRHPEAPSKECLAFQLGLAWPLARGSVFPHQEPALSSYQGVYQWSANTVPNLGNRNPYQATPLTIPSPSSWTRALLSQGFHTNIPRWGLFGSA